MQVSVAYPHRRL